MISAIGAGIMYRISRHIGDLYAQPMHWLLAGYAMTSLAVWEILIIRFTLGYLPPGPIQVISFIPTLLGGVLLFERAPSLNAPACINVARLVPGAGRG